MGPGGWRRLACLGVLALAAGCGSTITGATSGQSADSTGLSGPAASTLAPAGPGAHGGAGSSLPTSNGNTPIAGTSTVGTGLASAAANPGTATDAANAAGRSVTRQPLHVGFVYVGDANKALSSIGFSDLVVADPRPTYEAIVKYMNRTGGIAGRQIQGVYHSEEELSSTPYSTQDQAACADLTQDHHVDLIVTSTGTAEPTLMTECARKAGIPLVNTATAAGGGSFLARYTGYYYAPASIDTVSVGHSLVERMWQQGFFTKGARIGILNIDTTSFNDGVAHGINPALAAHGLRGIDTIPIDYGDRTSDASNTAAQIQNAELKFNAEHITHVLILEAGGGIAQFFMTDAGSQHYYPTYALTSGDDPGAILENDAKSSGQLQKSAGIGWFPLVDLGAAPLPPPNPATKLCQHIMKTSGQQSAARTVQVGQDIACGELFFLREAFAASPSVTTAGLRAGVDRLTGTYPSAAGFIDTFGPGRSTGAAYLRVFRYVAGCSCYRYTTGNLPILR